MTVIVITLCLSMSVRLLHFNLLLENNWTNWSQFGRSVRWMVKVLCFYTIQKSTAETRGCKVPKRLFFFVCGAFHPYWWFSPLFVKFSLCRLVCQQILYCCWCFQDIRCQNRTNSQNFELILWISWWKSCRDLLDRYSETPV